MRQSDYILRKIKKMFNKANKLKRSKNEAESIAAHQTYIDTATGYVLRVRRDIEILRGMGYDSILRLAAVEQYLAHAERQIDQIQRRVIDDETIPTMRKSFRFSRRIPSGSVKGKPAFLRNWG